MRTYVAKGEEAEALKVGANWFVVDATGVVLGRLATKVARMLMGKDKPTFTPYLDSGDHVVVINADKVRMTGNKVEQKVYYSHSGYPGGLKEVPAKRLRVNKADWMIREAVLGMLPKNRLANHPIGFVHAQTLRRHFLQSAGISAMRIIHLLLDLVPRHAHLIGIDHHNVIAGIQVWCKARLILADQHSRHFGGQPAQNLVGGIDHKPVRAFLQRFGLFSLGYVRPHRP